MVTYVLERTVLLRKAVPYTVYGFRCNIAFLSQPLSADQFVNTSFINNFAEQGGAMYLIAAGIISHSLNICGNKANEGGGIFLRLVSTPRFLYSS